MAFENFWRRDRHSHRDDRDQERDRNARYGERSAGEGRWGQDPDRGYGLGSPEGEGFQRRGWREGSDYYGDRDERYSGSQSGSRGEYGGSGERESWRRSPWNPEDQQGQWQGGRWQGGQGAGTREGVHYDFGERDQGWGGSNQGWNDEEFRRGYGSSSYGSQGGGGYGRDEDYGRRGALGYGGYGGMGGAETGSSAYGADAQFRGRGPRGYRRSDERIREEVCEALTDDAYIDASNVEVTVKDCEVTLSGSVTSREAKRRAESLAERLSGVKDVHNTLRVTNEQQRGSEQRTGEARSQSGEASSGTNQTPRH